MPRTCVMGCAITDDNRLHAFPKSPDRYNVWVERLCGGHPPSRSDLHACRRHFHKRFHYQWALAKTALPEYFLHPNSNYVAPDESESGDEHKEKFISSTPKPQPLRKHSRRVPIITLTQSKSIQTDNVEQQQLHYNAGTVPVINMTPQQPNIQTSEIVQPTVQVVPLEQSIISSMPPKAPVPTGNGIPVNSKISVLQNLPVIPVAAATPAVQPLPELTTTTVHTMCETRDIDEQQLVEIILPEIHVKDLKEGILLYQSDNMVTLEFLKPEYNSTLPGSTNNQQKENKEKEANEMNSSLKFMGSAKKIALEDKTKDTSIVKKNQSTCKVIQMQTKKDDTIINVEKLIKIQDPVKIKGVIKILKMSTLNANKPVSNVIDDSNQQQNRTKQECNKDKNITEEKEKCSEAKNYKRPNAGSVHQVTDFNQNQVNFYRDKSKEKYVNLGKQKLIEFHEEQLEEIIHEDDENVDFTEENQDESHMAALEQEEDDVSGKLNTSDLSETKENDKNQNKEKETNFKDNQNTEEFHNNTTVDVHFNIPHEEASDLILNNQNKEVELMHNLDIEKSHSSTKNEFQLDSKEEQTSEIIMKDQYKEQESELTNNLSTKKTQSEMKHKVQLSVNESDEKGKRFQNNLKSCDDNSEEIAQEKDEDSNGIEKKRLSSENESESQYKKAKFDQFSENSYNGRIEKVNNSLLNDNQDGSTNRNSIIEEEDIAEDEMNEHKKGESWSPLIWFDQIEIESYSNKNDNFSNETMSIQEDFLDEDNHTKHDNQEGKNQDLLDSSQKENVEKLGCKKLCEEHSKLHISEINNKEQKERERSKTKKMQRVNNETSHSDSKDGTSDGNNSTSASQHEDDKREPSGIVENEPESALSIISDHNYDTADIIATKSNNQHGKEEWSSTSKHKMSPVLDKENKTPDASKWKIEILPKGSLRPRILKVSRFKALGNSFIPIKGQLRQSSVLQHHLKRLSRTNRSYLSTKKLQLLKANLRDPLFVINTNSTGINNTKISTILTTATEVAAPKHATPIPPPPSSSSTPVMSQTQILPQVTPVCLHDKNLLQQDPKRLHQKTNKKPDDSIKKNRSDSLLIATDEQNLKHKQQSLLKKDWYPDIVNEVEGTPLQPCVEVQTDFRFQGICALVDTNRFHLNCFYCSEFYPLSLWPEFVQHIKTKHEIEKKSDSFISDHDYTLMTSPPEKKPSMRRLIIEKEIIVNDNVEENVSEGDDSKSSDCAFTKSRRNNLRELSAILQKKYCKTRKQSFKSDLFGKAHYQLKRFDNNRVAENTIIPIDDNNIIQDMTAGIMTMPVQWEVVQQTPSIQKTRPKEVGTPLKIEQVDPLNYVATPQGVNSRLQRHNIIAQHSLATPTNQQPINPSLDILQNYDNEEDLLKSKDGIGIVFGQTDNEVVIDFLLNLENFPLLYKHQNECYQKHYDDAILRMCGLLNDKYQLGITDLELRRSIHRVTDWYCFTLDDLERHNKAARAKRWRTTPLPPYPHAFPKYFEICARFLPNTRVCDNLLMKNIAQVVCKRYNQPVIYPSWVKFLPIPQESNNKRSQATPTPEHKVNMWGSLPKRKLSFEEPLEGNNEVKEENKIRKKPEDNVGKTRRREKPKQILNNRVFKCETCGREFRDRCMFRIHKLRHLPPRFKCDECTKEFYRNHQLQHHMRSRHATVPPFICEFCGKTISSQNSLKIHIDNKHHNVRFNCVVCQYTTYTSSKLKKHQKKWHVAVEGTVEQLSRRKIAYDKFNMTSNCTELDHKATKLWMSSVKVPGIKNYTCTLCHLVFDNLKDIKRHNRQLHPIRCITYMCVLCRPNKMITRNNLRRHYERIHHAHGDEITELMKRSKPVLALASGRDRPAEHDNNVKTNVDDLYRDLMEQNENNFDQEACDIINIKKEEITEAVASLKHEMCLRSSLDEVKIDDEYLETIFESTT